MTCRTGCCQVDDQMKTASNQMPVSTVSAANLQPPACITFRKPFAQLEGFLAAAAAAAALMLLVTLTQFSTAVPSQWYGEWDTRTCIETTRWRDGRRRDCCSGWLSHTANCFLVLRWRSAVTLRVVLIVLYWPLARYNIAASRPACLHNCFLLQHVNVTWSGASIYDLWLYVCTPTCTLVLMMFSTSSSTNWSTLSFPTL